MGGMPHRYQSRGEYDRPPPKSTELFDPKAPPNSSSSSSSYTSPSHSLFSPSAVPLSTVSSMPTSLQPPRSYSASRAATGTGVIVPPSNFPVSAPSHHTQHPPAPSYENMLSGAISNIKINSQPKSLWGDHTFIYSPGPTHYQHRGGYGLASGRGGSVCNGRGSARAAIGGEPGYDASAMSKMLFDNGSQWEDEISTSLTSQPTSTSNEESSGDCETSGVAEGSIRARLPHQPRVVSFPHILEVELSSEVQEDSAEITSITDTLKKAGANVKFVDRSILAIFKTANAASKGSYALESRALNLTIASFSALHSATGRELLPLQASSLGCPSLTWYLLVLQRGRF